MDFVSVTPVSVWHFKFQYALWPPGLNRDPAIGALIDEKACFHGVLGGCECEKGAQETFTNDQLGVSSLFGKSLTPLDGNVFFNYILGIVTKGTHP